MDVPVFNRFALLLAALFWLSGSAHAMNCNVDGDGSYLPMDLDVNRLIETIVSGSACPIESCDFNQDGMGPDVGDAARLLSIRHGGNSSGFCTNPWALTAITLTPAISASVQVGTSLPIGATCTYQNGTTSDCRSSITFTVSNTSRGNLNDAWAFVGISPGVTNITATSGSISREVLLTVTAEPVTLTSIALSPSSFVMVPMDERATITAICSYSSGSTGDCTQTATWSLSHLDRAIMPSPGVVSMSSLTHPVSIKASLDGLSASILVLVNQRPTLTGIQCTPTSGSAPLSVTCQVQGANDPENAGRDCYYDWKDGSQIQTVSATYPALGCQTGLTHTYASPGTYNATGWVNDGFRTSLTAYYQPITVTQPANNAPTLAGFTCTPTNGTTPLTVSCAFSGPADVDGTPVTCWTYSSQEQPVQANCSNPVTKVFSTPGTFDFYGFTWDGQVGSQAKRAVIVTSAPINNTPAGTTPVSFIPGGSTAPATTHVNGLVPASLTEAQAMAGWDYNHWFNDCYPSAYAQDLLMEDIASSHRLLSNVGGLTIRPLYYQPDNNRRPFAFDGFWVNTMYQCSTNNPNYEFNASATLTTINLNDGMTKNLIEASALLLFATSGDDFRSKLRRMALYQELGPMTGLGSPQYFQTITLNQILVLGTTPQAGDLWIDISREALGAVLYHEAGHSNLGHAVATIRASNAGIATAPQGTSNEFMNLRAAAISQALEYQADGFSAESLKRLSATGIGYKLVTAVMREHEWARNTITELQGYTPTPNYLQSHPTADNRLFVMDQCFNGQVDYSATGFFQPIINAGVVPRSASNTSFKLDEKREAILAQMVNSTVDAIQNPRRGSGFVSKTEQSLSSPAKYPEFKNSLPSNQD